MEEIWKTIVGFEGKNEVSNLGRVRSLTKNKLMTISMRGNEPYPFVQLQYNGRPRPYRIHRLVAEAFIPNPDKKPCVNHIDFDKTNNCVNNLEWVTYSENTCHNHKYGRANTRVGSSLTQAKLTEDDVLIILKRLDSGEKAAEIEKDYAINRHQLSKIRNGLAWKHVDFDRSTVATRRYSDKLIQELKAQLVIGKTCSELGRQYQISRKTVKRLTA